MENGFSGFTFTIDNDGHILTNQVLVGGQNNMFSLSSDDLVLEVTSVSPRFTGRIRSKQAALELGEYSLSLDATFDVVVTRADKYCTWRTSLLRCSAVTNRNHRQARERE